MVFLHVCPVCEWGVIKVKLKIEGKEYEKVSCQCGQEFFEIKAKGKKVKVSNPQHDDGDQLTLDDRPGRRTKKAKEEPGEPAPVVALPQKVTVKQRQEKDEHSKKGKKQRVFRKEGNLLHWSIDGLTFVGEDANMLEWLEIEVGVMYRTHAKFPYKWTYHLANGAVLQEADCGGGAPSVQHGEREDIAGLTIQEQIDKIQNEDLGTVDTSKRKAHVMKWRFEFNPKHAEESHEIERLYVGVLAHMKYLECTRMDIAFDFDLDMGNWEWIDDAARNQIIFYSGTKLKETVYIGAKDSDLRIRIYNKKNEQGSKYKKQFKEGHWWRVEAQIRGDMARKFHEYQFNVNPFQGIVASSKTFSTMTDKGMKELELSITERAMVMYLMENPEGFGELAKNTRKKYKELIKLLSCMDTLNFENLWTNKKEALYKEYLTWWNMQSLNKATL